MDPSIQYVGHQHCRLEFLTICVLDILPGGLAMLTMLLSDVWGALGNADYAPQ
jgi:hypothetical protein